MWESARLFFGKNKPSSEESTRSLPEMPHHLQNQNNQGGSKLADEVWKKVYPKIICLILFDRKS